MCLCVTTLDFITRVTRVDGSVTRGAGVGGARVAWLCYARCGGVGGYVGYAGWRLHGLRGVSVTETHGPCDTEDPDCHWSRT